MRKLYKVSLLGALALAIAGCAALTGGKKGAILSATPVSNPAAATNTGTGNPATNPDPGAGNPVTTNPGSGSGSGSNPAVNPNPTTNQPTTTNPGTTTTGGSGGSGPDAGGGNGTGSTDTGRVIVSCANPQYTQMERLGRPAVNEGLVTTNDLLNAFNSVPPTTDLAAGAADVRTNVVNTLAAFGTNLTTTAPVDANHANLLKTGNLNLVVANFLPDVMRIDTNMVSSGYVGTDNLNNLTNMTDKGRLIGGRFITDDVMDATYLYLVSAGVGGTVGFTDGVSYSTAPHQMPTNSFPYLAPPN